MAENSKQILQAIILASANIQMSELVAYNIQDLEFLIERHTQNRYNEKNYDLIFNSKELSNLVLDSNDADLIVYFLFFLLFNFPDRAGHTSLAIKKCYGYDITTGCCNGIKIYVERDDFTTINLLDAILNQTDTGQIPPSASEYFTLAREKGLPFTKQFLEKHGYY